MIYPLVIATIVCLYGDSALEGVGVGFLVVDSADGLINCSRSLLLLLALRLSFYLYDIMCSIR